MGEAPLAPSRIHGSLVEVAGVGVLLLGKSGIGKSECALELVMRGHRLVADDVVLVGCDDDGQPVGWSPELVRHYVELRGIGIVHVPSMFGESAVAERARIELVVQLEAWGAGEVERVGLDRHKEVFAGFEIAALHLPVAPGRNIASLVEVAARVHLLRRQGKSGVAELDERLSEALRGEALRGGRR
jgi:HPr kinase/phosphorylase